MLNRLLACIGKELLLLRRDRAGMLVLFVMPAVLVLVITLVQENVLKLMGESTTRILMLDQEQTGLGDRIADRLVASGRATLVREVDGRLPDESTAMALVAGGGYQACIVVPAGTGEAIRRRAGADFGISGAGEAETLPTVRVYFDPIVLGVFRSGIMNAVRAEVLGMEAEERMRATARHLRGLVRAEVMRNRGPQAAGMIEIPEFPLPERLELRTRIEERAAGRGGLAQIPSSVQQNVPAWSLFGIFFIVVPLAGSLLAERRSTTIKRLFVMPVSPLTLLTGKVVAYVLVCLTQCGLILVIGRYLLPALGTPAFGVGPRPLTALLVALCAILAATGYGTLLGVVARTYEQAAMFGSISVVVAAALGGVMVPVYAMPKLMQLISVVSPLNWGLEAFLDIFVRGGSLASVGGWLAGLLAFFTVTMLLAWSSLLRGIRSGR